MSVARNLSTIREGIRRACDASDRKESEVVLVAVTKTVDVAAIREAYDLGHRDFGESRLQEAQPKIESLPADIRWHFVGHLQSNKARKIAQLFDVIHTIDSPSQLEELGKGTSEAECFIEVNIADEVKKAGISADSLDDFAQTVLNYRQVHLTGLMTIGPQVEDAEQSRVYFGRLRNLAKRIGVHKLSMGMSRDYEVAIQEGATHVRIGSAIFGSRN